MDTIISEYSRVSNTKSDIHEHIPTLRKYADECSHVTEFGVRFVVSTWGLLAGFPDTYIGYDIRNEKDIPAVGLAKQACDKAGISFTYKQESTLTCTIEPTELLMIDTWHVYDQLIAELRRHSSNVSKYILMHDTTTWGDRGEDYDYGNGKKERKGLKLAIEEFLSEHKEWKTREVFTNNNGLTVLERV